MTINRIRTHTQSALSAAQQTLDQKMDKDNPTEHDEDCIAALEEFISAVEQALDDLDDCYQAQQ